MPAIVLLAITMMLQVSCKKSDQKAASSQQSSNVVKFNPEGCSITETFVTSNSVKTLSKRDYFSGEKLDSTIRYQADGSVSSIVHWTVYDAGFKESLNYTAQRKYTAKGSTWYDANDRIIRQRSEDANGSIIYDNAYEYRCK